MSDSIIKLHPKSYKELIKPIIFFISGKENKENKESKVSKENFDAIYQELRKSKTLVVTSYKKNVAAERNYYLYIGRYVLIFCGSEHTNLQCKKIIDGKDAANKKAKLYKTKAYTIIPTGGVYIVYGGDKYPQVDDNSWEMDQNAFYDLLDSMEEYFDSDEEEEKVENEKKESIKISERFKRNIIRPFRDYTDKENWVEQYKQTQGEGVLYFKRSFEQKNNKGSIYNFYSKDENADPEKGYYSAGDRIIIIDSEHNDCGVYTGVLENIDNESEDAVIFSIAFYHQFDDVDIPEQGKIVTAINDTQTKVRSRVIRSMERCKIESKYMYHTFADFSVEGYENIPDDLKEYLVEKMADRYPPNQMQMEAIIKGILTKDILLVLGPPGTGKTTVISFWVEYFIRKGQRVLISSQNNAAVDNVLARFGKLAETVRLGNENKVQDNCKDYLPQNKIASMQSHFNSNFKRVGDEIAHNISELNKYKEKVLEYQHLYEYYFEKKQALGEYVSINRTLLSQLSLTHSNVEQTSRDIDDIMQMRAHKDIFLQVYETKNALIKLLRRKYAKRVQEELKKSEEALQEKRKKYVEVVRNYNSFADTLKRKVQELRQKSVVEEYKKALREIEAYTEYATSEGFLPNLMGELATIYSNPGYSKNKDENSSILEREKMVINELEKSINKMKDALSEWNNLVNNERNDIMQNALLETCQIVGATCIGINSNRDFANVKFDVAIVDESGQIQIHNALVPMTRARKNLLLGDYKQIPPCANEEVLAACKAEEIDTSLLNMSFFEYVFESMRKKTIHQLESQGLDRNLILKPILEDYQPEPYKEFDPIVVQDMIKRVVEDPKKLVNLNSQFRMPSNISDIISEWFYEGNYHSSYDYSKFSPMVPGTDKPLVVVTTSEAGIKNESQPESKMGYQNHYEARIIADMVENVINSQPNDTKNMFLEKIEDNIGIISAYGAQVRLIREYLSKKKFGIKDTQIRSMVASLDSFQGQERPLIFYSLTRSTSYKAPEVGRVGFMKELRRLNVAFTRCQKQLVIVGDMDYLSECVNMEKVAEGESEWPCAGQDEEKEVTQAYIDQCAECPAVCERKFARFIRLLMQHVNQGAGILLQSEEYLRRNA